MKGARVTKAFCCGYPLTRDVAVVVQSAVDAAAAMHKCVQQWKRFKNVVTADPASELVSYQQADACIIFNISSKEPFQFVQVSGLPKEFIEVQQAQQAQQVQFDK